MLMIYTLKLILLKIQVVQSRHLCDVPLEVSERLPILSFNRTNLLQVKTKYHIKNGIKSNTSSQLQT